jgi:hypothetical protein
MSYPVEVFPDDELALLQYLRAVPDLTALIDGDKILTELPASPAYPYVLIQRAGGQVAVWQAVDEPALQVDVVGGTKFVCKQIMRTVRAAILAIGNDVVDEGVLSSATEEVGPQWLPDTIPTPPVARYTSRYRIFIHN